MLNKMRMSTTIVFFLILLICSPAFSQEKVVDNITVELGVISWSDIEKGFKTKPRTPIEERYLEVIRKMAQTHGKEVEGSYHILVVLIDKTSGKRIKDADVELTAIAKKGSEKIKHTLQPMIIDNYSEYGQFFKLSSKSSYILEVKFSLKGAKKVYKVKFERSLE